MTDWFVGQKVVCVDASHAPRHLIVSGELLQGAVYTIRGFLFWEGQTGLYLEELRCGPSFDGDECAPFANRFRPLVNQNADISVFTKLLEPLNSREPVDA